MHPFCFSSRSSSSASSLLVLHLLLLLLRLSSPSLAWAPVSRTITVDRQGRGDFSTVQSAVDSVPDGNRDWVKVHVNAGSYWEKVTIAKQKGYILLEGDGSSTTDISFNTHAHAGIDQIMRRPERRTRRILADVPQRHLHRPRRQLRRPGHLLQGTYLEDYIVPCVPGRPAS
nr:unnamed protein product [Digitaria exilis]